MLLRESLQSDRPAPQRGDSDSVATRNTVKMSSAAAMMSLSTTMMSPVSTNTSTLGHASDSGTSAATIGIIVGILAVLLVIIVVLVVILLRRRNNARSDTADARPVGRKQKPAQQHALPLPPAAIAENGRRLAAVETLPYIPPQPVPVNGGRHGNKDTIGSRDTYDGAYNGRSAADQDPSLMLRPSIDPVQNEAYEDVIAVSIPHREYTPLNDYENVIINNMKTPASREPSRNSQYSTTSEDAHLLASRQPSAQAPALQTIQGSLSSESMSLVDESAYASPEELVAVIRRHAAAYENLGICAAPLKPALSAALSAPGPKPKVPPRRHNKQLEATASDASHLPMVDRIYADDYYDNSELLRAGVTTEPTGADASLEDSYESSMTSPHAYDDVIHQSSRDSAGVMRGQLSTSAPVASDSIGVSSTAGAALYDSGNECHEAIGAQNSTAGLIPTGRNHGYEEVELLKPSAKSTVAPHQTYERLTSKQYREIPSSEIHKVNMVGKGSFGEVWLGKWITPDGKSVDVAVKSLHSTCDALSKGKLLEEANLLGRFHHRNIVQLHGVTQSSTNNQQPQLVLQWAERGCLLAWLRTTRPGENGSAQEIAERLLMCCTQIAAGLVFLQRVNFVHRDLAARNVLLSEDLTCMICDFGMSKILAEESYYSSHGGKLPVKWSPPEVILKRKFSIGSDIWSYAVVLYEIWSLGRKPYFPHPAVKVAEDVCAGYRLPAPPGCPLELYRLMIECWHTTPSKRPTATQILSRLNSIKADNTAESKDAPSRASVCSTASSTAVGLKVVQYLGLPHNAAHLPEEFTTLQNAYHKPPVKPRLSRR